jgi:hypothetical protein
MSTDVSEERIASSFRDKKISKPRYQKQAYGKECLLTGLLFDLQDRGDKFLRNFG